jgi:hypothetical protein
MGIDTAKNIRNAIKALGYGSRDVGVRNDSYSLGSSVYVTIKRADIELEKIQAAASQFENIHRCEATGEILGGGNTYVHVRYATGLFASYAATAEALLAGGRREFGRLTLSEADRDQMQVWDGSRPVVRLWLGSGAGENLAEVLAARGQLACLVDALVARANEVAAEMAPAANDVAPAAPDYSTDPNFTLC